MRTLVEREDLILPELCYDIIGCAYEVFKAIGHGHKEAIYQKALSIAFKDRGMLVREQEYYPVKFKTLTIGRNYFDFLINDLVVVEIKKDLHFSKANIDQVLNYLKVSGLQLAILINFGPEGATFKRIINFDSK